MASRLAGNIYGSSIKRLVRSVYENKTHIDTDSIIQQKLARADSSHSGGPVSSVDGYVMKAGGANLEFNLESRILVPHATHWNRTPKPEHLSRIYRLVCEKANKKMFARK